MPTYPNSYNLYSRSKRHVRKQRRRSKVNWQSWGVRISKCNDFGIKIKLGLLESFSIEKRPYDNSEARRHGARRRVKMGKRGSFERPNWAKTEEHRVGQPELVIKVIQLGRAVLVNKEEPKILIKRNRGPEKLVMARLVNSIIQRQIPEHLRRVRDKSQTKLLPMWARDSFGRKVRQKWVPRGVRLIVVWFIFVNCFVSWIMYEQINKNLWDHWVTEICEWKRDWSIVNWVSVAALFAFVEHGTTLVCRPRLDHVILHLGMVAFRTLFLDYHLWLSPLLLLNLRLVLV